MRCIITSESRPEGIEASICVSGMYLLRSHVDAQERGTRTLKLRDIIETPPGNLILSGDSG